MFGSCFWNASSHPCFGFFSQGSIMVFSRCPSVERGSFRSQVTHNNDNNNGPIHCKLNLVNVQPLIAWEVFPALFGFFRMFFVFLSLSFFPSFSFSPPPPPPLFFFGGGGKWRGCVTSDSNLCINVCTGGGGGGGRGGEIKRQ